ncbi:MAG TPA: hypothetical protein PLZ86_08810, partial [bacterium]|nr:hypothetical protein [bacterium]
MADRIKVEVRAPHWLPLPIPEDPSAVDSEPVVEANDLFAKGRVVLFYERQGVGVMKGARGERLPFSVSEVELVGPKNHARFISEGAPVGYDVGWSSHGMRVSR